MEKHHIIPLAIWWLSNQDNYIYIESKEHKLVHNILNIPYKHIREYREQLNWLLLLNEKVIESERKMQLMYFDNIDDLPKKSIYDHYLSIMQQAKLKTKTIINNKEAKEWINWSINKINDLKQKVLKDIIIISWINFEWLSDSEKLIIKKMIFKNKFNKLW